MTSIHEDHRGNTNSLGQERHRLTWHMRSSPPVARSSEFVGQTATVVTSKCHGFREPISKISMAPNWNIRNTSESEWFATLQLCFSMVLPVSLSLGQLQFQCVPSGDSPDFHCLRPIPSKGGHAMSVHDKNLNKSIGSTFHASREQLSPRWSVSRKGRMEWNWWNASLWALWISMSNTWLQKPSQSHKFHVQTFSTPECRRITTPSLAVYAPCFTVTLKSSRASLYMYSKHAVYALHNKCNVWSM